MKMMLPNFKIDRLTENQINVAIELGMRAGYFPKAIYAGFIGIYVVVYSKELITEEQALELAFEYLVNSDKAVPVFTNFRNVINFLVSNNLITLDDAVFRRLEND